MNEEKNNSNFDINTKYEDMINISQRIIEYHEFVSDGSCEPPNYICLAYDVKNHLPDLLRENQQLKEAIYKMSKIIHEIDDSRNSIGGYPSDYIDYLLEILKEVK